MDEFVFDRVFGKPFPSPEHSEDVILGRWTIRSSKKNPVYQNSILSKDGDFLIPDFAGNWQIRANGQPARSGSFRKPQLISQLERKSLLGVGNLLENILEKKGGWKEWLDVSPIAPEVDDKLEFKTLEEKTEKLFGHLKEVCSRPRAYILHEIEPVYIHKSRRLATRAIPHLASHTEDWESRQLIRGGVVPKRILSEVRNENFDIYENRVAVRLVDNLSVYLTQRIREVKKVIKLFEDKQNFEVHGSHLLRRRIFELWGKAITDNDQMGGARKILEKLESLNYKVKGLMNSDLYRDVPRMAKVDPSLKMTNILANDQHYRRVAELWKEWVRSGLSEAESSQKFYVESQKVMNGMDCFLHLLVVRAFYQLHYKSLDQQAEVKRGSSIELKKGVSQCTCEWKEQGHIKIVHDGKIMTIVSVMMDFRKERNDSQLESILFQFKQNFDSSDGELLIAFCSSDEPNKELSKDKLIYFDNVGNDPRIDLPVALVSVSPWDIFSVERIASSLKYFLEKEKFTNYPRKIKLDDKWLILANKGDLPAGVTLKDTELIFEKPVLESEWESCGLNRKKEDLNRDLEEEKKVLEQQEKSRTRSKPRKIKQLEQDTKNLNGLILKINEAFKSTKSLLDCPSCGKTVDPNNFEARNSGCFYSSCESCLTSWELKTCGSCGEVFGVILPGGNYPPNSEDLADQGAKFYGSDILSPPVKEDNGDWKFLCTNTNCESNR